MYGVRKAPYSNPYKLDKRDDTVINNRLKWTRNQPVNPSYPNKKIAKRENLKKTNQPDNVVFCNFYIKFGSCRNGKSCRYEHDPKRIRTCPEYIKHGSCKTDGCKLRHAPDPHTMEPCHHFILGNCTKGQSCPFPHIKVATNARLCLNFQQGFCHQGDLCRLKHERKDCHSIGSSEFFVSSRLNYICFTHYCEIQIEKGEEGRKR